MLFRNDLNSDVKKLLIQAKVQAHSDSFYLHNLTWTVYKYIGLSQSISCGPTDLSSSFLIVLFLEEPPVLILLGLTKADIFWLKQQVKKMFTDILITQLRMVLNP